jgi:hypothetical protein
VAEGAGDTSAEHKDGGPKPEAEGFGGNLR